MTDNKGFPQPTRYHRELPPTRPPGNWLETLLQEGILRKVNPYMNEQGYLTRYDLTKKGREWLEKLKAEEGKNE